MKTTQIVLETPINGAKIQVLNDDVYTFTVGYQEGASEPYIHRGDNYAPKSVRLAWRSTLEVKGFKVVVSSTADFSKQTTYDAQDTSIELFAPFYHTCHFWKVQAVQDGVVYESEVHSFVLEGLPKCLFIEGVSNTREVYGYRGIDGRKIGRNRLYRGGNVDKITEDGQRYVAERLSIRTDLDLRKITEGTAAESFSPLGAQVSHVHSSGCMYLGEEGLQTSAGQKLLLDELRVFVARENYPIYVHCVLGRDRTGTLLTILLALCGVSKEDIFYDYELSFFSKIACHQDTHVPKMLGFLNEMFDYLHSFRGDTLQEKTADFLLQIGMRETDLYRIQENLLTEDCGVE